MARYAIMPAEHRLTWGRMFLADFRIDRKDTLTIAHHRGFREAEVVKLMHLAREHERRVVPS